LVGEGCVYAVLAFDKNNKVYTYNGKYKEDVIIFGNVFEDASKKGRVSLLSKADLHTNVHINTFYKNKNSKNKSKRNLLCKLERLEIVKVTSKRFKKFYKLEYKDNNQFITPLYEYDLLLYKALKII
jgi:Neuraminidase (sialidase)